VDDTIGARHARSPAATSAARVRGRCFRGRSSAPRPPRPPAPRLHLPREPRRSATFRRTAPAPVTAAMVRRIGVRAGRCP